MVGTESEIWTMYPKKDDESGMVGATRNFYFGKVRLYAEIFPPLSKDGAWETVVGYSSGKKSLNGVKKTYKELVSAMNQLLHSFLEENDITNKSIDLNPPSEERINEMVAPYRANERYSEKFLH